MTEHEDTIDKATEKAVSAVEQRASELAKEGSAGDAAGATGDTTGAAPSGSAKTPANSDAPKRPGGLSRFFTLEMLLAIVAVLSGGTLLWTAIAPSHSIPVMIAAGMVFTLSIVLFIRLSMDPDSVRARQSDAMLRLASRTLESMQEGLNRTSAQEICQLLLPSTAAIAVAITDKTQILGYAGYLETVNPTGSDIRTHATQATLDDGTTRVLFTNIDIGFPEHENTTIKAAIIVPLLVRGDVCGTLKFYYRSAKRITETQKSIAEGFGQLLSTQMAAAALEEQARLAASMELKALQNQINPHFLFNTINTIASLIRTDPNKARVLLREFAVFYRRTLENSDSLIYLSREVEQTKRYFTFEIARFGEDRVELDVNVDAECENMMVPSFLIQPLVENAVQHAMPSEGKLTIEVSGEVTGDDVVLRVTDDGTGMTEEARQGIMHPEHTKGIGIAVKNVHDRIMGFFGPGSYMDVQSELGAGTTVTLFLEGCADQSRKASSDISAVQK